MRYYAYDYHSSPVRPVQRELNCIFGLELEISDSNVEVREALNDAICDNILTVPDNEHETDNLKCLENDSSVFKEIIFRADKIEDIIPRVQTLEQYLNSEIMANHRGTSAHIHINREYLEELGISNTNIYKMAEFHAPFLYAISGRDNHYWNRWSSTYLNHDFYSKTRGRSAGRLTADRERYHIINLRNSATVELRCFSNYYNFNSEIIKFYFDVVLFLLEECQYMKGRCYRDETEALIEHLIQFMETHEEIISKYWYDKTQVLTIARNDQMQYHLNSLNNRIIEAKVSPSYGVTHYIDIMYPVLRKFNLLRVTLTGQGIQNINRKVLQKYYTDMSSYCRLYLMEVLQSIQQTDY